MQAHAVYARRRLQVTISTQLPQSKLERGVYTTRREFCWNHLATTVVSLSIPDCQVHRQQVDYDTCSEFSKVLLEVQCKHHPSYPFQTSLWNTRQKSAFWHSTEHPCKHQQSWIELFEKPLDWKEKWKMQLRKRIVKDKMYLKQVKDANR